MKRRPLAEIERLAAEPLSPEEFERRVGAPMTEEEIEETAALYRWFTTRYSTPLERLAYARRKYAEWTRKTPIERRRP